MTPENFAYWLQGLFEVGKLESLDKVQTQQIKDHLELVFKKETPTYNVIYKDMQTTAEQPFQEIGGPLFQGGGTVFNFDNNIKDLPGMPDLAYFPGISC